MNKLTAQNLEILNKSISKSPDKNNKPLLSGDKNKTDLPQHESKSLNNLESIKKLENSQNKELLYQKLKEQNIKLSSEIGLLNDQLNKILEKQKINKIRERQEANKGILSEVRIDALEGELRNAYQQLEILKKENIFFKKKCNFETLEGKNESIIELLKHKNEEIEKIQHEIKNYEKQQRENEKKLEILKQDSTKTQHSKIMDELSYWKSKLSDLEIKEQSEMTIAKKKEGYIMKLQENLNELYQKAKLDPNRHETPFNVKTKRESNNSNNNRASSEKSSKSISNLRNMRNQEEQESNLAQNINQSFNQYSSSKYRNLSHNSPKKYSTIESPVKRNFDTKKNERDLNSHQETSILDEPFSKEAFKDLYYAVKVLEKAIKINGKKNERDIEHLKNLGIQTENENTELKEKLKQKEKDKEVLAAKYDKLKKILKHSQLPTIEELQSTNDDLKPIFVKKAARNKTINKIVSKERNSITSISKNHLKKKMDNSLELLPNEYKSPDRMLRNNYISPSKPKPALKEVLSLRKDERGKSKIKSKGFDDMDIIKLEKNIKIIGVKLWHSENGISGIQGFYSCEGKSLLKGSENVRASGINDQTTTFLVENNDYIKYISGFLDKTESHIQCLIFHSSKGISQKIGDYHQDSRLFKFDITSSEYPVCFCGALEPILADDKSSEIGSSLCRLGTYIQYEDIEEKINPQLEKKTRHKNIIQTKELINVNNSMM